MLRYLPCIKRYSRGIINFRANDEYKNYFVKVILSADGNKAAAAKIYIFMTTLWNPILECEIQTDLLMLLLLLVMVL